jgi:hypothetical protein
VPNAGGDPGGGAGGAGVAPFAASATRPAAAAPARPSAEPFKNCLRELDMPATIPELGWKMISRFS